MQTDSLEGTEKGGNEGASRQDNREDETSPGALNQDCDSWRCPICNTPCGIVHHLRSSPECLAQLRLKPEYQFNSKGSVNEEIFITKFCLIKGACPHVFCQDAEHSVMPSLCFEWCGKA